MRFAAHQVRIPVDDCWLSRRSTSQSKRATAANWEQLAWLPRIIAAVGGGWRNSHQHFKLAVQYKKSYQKEIMCCMWMLSTHSVFNRAWYQLFQEVILTMILPTKVPASVYIDFENGQPACEFRLSEGWIWLDLTRGQLLISSPVEMFLQKVRTIRLYYEFYIIVHMIMSEPIFWIITTKNCIKPSKSLIWIAEIVLISQEKECLNSSCIPYKHAIIISW